MEAMGVFDGHGGKGAGQYTAKHIMSAVTAGLKESGVSKSSAEQGESEGSEMAGLQSDLAGDDVDAWQLQDAAVEQLPEALSHAFQQVQQDFFAQSKVCTWPGLMWPCIAPAQQFLHPYGDQAWFVPALGYFASSPWRSTVPAFLVQIINAR